MAKRGQFFPYRIKFVYPPSERSATEIKGTLCLMSPVDVAREREQLLGRGATVEVYKVHPNGLWDLKARTTHGEWLDERAVTISRRAQAEIVGLLDNMIRDYEGVASDDLLSRIDSLRIHVGQG